MLRTKLHLLQIECCGVTGPKSYLSNNLSIPLTCYKNGDAQSELYEVGCLEKIRNNFHSVGTQLGAIAIGVAVIEVFQFTYFMLLKSH